jgi:hypothetical protein
MSWHHGGVSDGAAGDDEDTQTPAVAPFDPLDHTRILWRSMNLTVQGEFESVRAYGSKLPGQVVVGDHYGDVMGAAVDDAERWCVTVGCGVIVYKLADPWQEYNYDLVTDQWWEMYREPEDMLLTRDVRFISGAKFTCWVRRDDREPDLYELDAEARTFAPIPAADR